MQRQDRSTRSVLFALVCLVLVPATTRAQASVSGVVKDTSGTVLPGVTVEASSPSLFKKFSSVVTDDAGRYRIVDLVPGTYAVTFTLAGFSNFRREGLELAGSIAATVNAELKVTSAAEKLTVEGPASVASDRAGGAYTVSPRLDRIFRITANGVLSVVAGSQRYWFSGDGGPARSALFAAPEGIAVDAGGNLFIADTWNHRVRKVSRLDDIITTVAGNGSPGFSGDGGPATSAELFSPESIAVDTAGNLYVGESGNHRIRKVSSSGIISTVAGNGTPGFSGDGGPATSAQLSFPRGVAVDAAGNLFIAEPGHRVRRVRPDGTITTVAGNGTSGFKGDGGPAASAQLASPHGVAVDAAGNLFIADAGNHRIRKVTPDGVITTVAGNGTVAPPAGRRRRGPDGAISTVNEGSSSVGDGGPATAAQLNSPQDVAVDAAGNLFIADLSNRIRKVSPEGIISTIAGN